MVVEDYNSDDEGQNREKTIDDLQVTDDDFIHFDYLENGLRLIDQKR
jgi:hypothetical protein